MAGIFGYSREAVRVKVKKCEGTLPAEWRKFSVDPQITSLEVLFSILAKAFDLRTDFSISCRSLDAGGQEQFLAVLSDWDLDAAFLRVHNLSVANASEPCLNLRIDIKPFSEAPDWDATGSLAANTAPLAASHNGQQQQQQPQPQQQTVAVMPGAAMSSSGGAQSNSAAGIRAVGTTGTAAGAGAGQKYVQTMQTRLPGLILNQMEKTISMVTRALNFVDDQTQLIPPPPRPPLSDTEFRSFLDSVGQIVQPRQLRRVIYAGGIDPSLRRVVWKHILNVYPDAMTGRERMDYMKRKSAEYQRLRETWRVAVQRGGAGGGAGAGGSPSASASASSTSSELAYVTSMVRKDVLRTDRLHPFYAGGDDNQNIAALFNILTTYALNHPTVSYCQGMSDIASPLLVTMCDEAQAYICFCAVMRRLSANFQLDGAAMTVKFAHLAEALQFYDPEMSAYLREQQADDLLFCYRWLLLEMKREFAFEDALRMLEVLWSALPAEQGGGELRLAEREFVWPPREGGVVGRGGAGADVRLLAQDGTSNTTDSAIEGQPTASGSPVVMRRAARETAYTKICALRRQSSAQSLAAAAAANGGAASDHRHSAGRSGLDATKRWNHSLDDNATARRRSRIASAVARQPAHHSLDERETQTQERSPTEPEKLIGEAGGTEKTDSNGGDAKPATATAQRKGGGHFKELKERIVAGKKAAQLASPTAAGNATAVAAASGAKVVRNFNEFLNLGGGRQTKAASNREAVAAAVADEPPSPPDVATEREAGGGSSGGSSGGNEPLANNNECSSPDDSQEYFPMTTSMTRELRLELENLDRQVFGTNLPSVASVAPAATTGPFKQTNPFLMDEDTLMALAEADTITSTDLSCDLHEIAYSQLQSAPSVSLDIQDTQPAASDASVCEITRCPSDRDLLAAANSTSSVIRRSPRARTNGTNGHSNRCSTSSANTDIFVWENPLHCFSPPPPPLTSSASASAAMDTDAMDSMDCGESVIETECEGKTSITPIRLVAANGSGSSASSRRSSRRSHGRPPQRNAAAQQQRYSGHFAGASADSSDSDADDRTVDLSSDTDDEEHASAWQPSDTMRAMAATTAASTTSIHIDLPSPVHCSEPGSLQLLQLNGGSAAAAGGVGHEQQLSSSVEEASEAALPVAPALPAASHPSETNAAPSATQSSPAQRLAAGCLPPPHEFGGGNPFLMFLCVTLLMQHRNYVMRAGMDYNEMAMHFDKMVRKHNVTRVLAQARRMYGDYMRQQQQLQKQREEEQQQQQQVISNGVGKERSEGTEDGVLQVSSPAVVKRMEV